MRPSGNRSHTGDMGDKRSVVFSSSCWAVRKSLRQGLVRRESVADQITKAVHDFDVRSFIVTADVVDLARGALGKAKFYGPTVILDEEPVSDLHPVPVDRKRLSVKDLDDHQRDQLLGELERPVVVGAVGGRDVQSERVVIRTDEVVAGSLARGVR